MDDQLALIPAAMLAAYFRPSFLRSSPPRGGYSACPATHRWPEGRLTDALRSSAVKVSELRGVSTCLAGAPANGLFKCSSGEVDFGDAPQADNTSPRASAAAGSAAQLASAPARDAPPRKSSALTRLFPRASARAEAVVGEVEVRRPRAT